MIVRVSVDLNRTVVDKDWRFDKDVIGLLSRIFFFNFKFRFYLACQIPLNDHCVVTVLHVCVVILPVNWWSWTAVSSFQAPFSMANCSDKRGKWKCPGVPFLFLLFFISYLFNFALMTEMIMQRMKWKTAICIWMKCSPKFERHRCWSYAWNLISVNTASFNTSWKRIELMTCVFD